eukprot:Polyplicarium_translucidae@DN2618_c0_g1_i1.p2
MIAAGVPYEDVIIGFSEEERQKYPMRQVPVLEVDGKQLCQTEAIIAYLGHVTKMAPTDPWLNAKHSEILGSLSDLFGRLYPSMMESDPEKKKALREVFVTFLKRWLTCMDAIIEKAGTKSGFAVCEDLTIADASLFHVVKTMKSGVWDDVPADSADNFKHIMRQYNAVLASPQKKKYDGVVKEKWQ